ncbi:ROK family transcriptional regulator [Brachybacterium hainanense]|uniref:ROK family protein n=1 Tax=Brachybacterium hainanense TaxID=1541174 RepID=A0ABV6RCD4_9MICO
MRGSTMPDIGARNEMVVLQAIRLGEDGIAQAEVMRRSGLSRQAVSQIVRRLIDRGLVETDGTRSNGRGKPSTVLRIVPRAMLAAGVHLDPAQVTVVIVDLLARVVAQRSLGLPASSPEADVRRIGDAVADMLGQLRAEGFAAADGGDVAGAVAGLGIAAPAGLDSARGILLDPPWLPTWRHVPIVAQLEAATGLRVVLDKDTNAALTAESWAGSVPGDETVLYIYVGAGVGSAVAGDGTVHRGSTTQAGEIGHLPTGLDGPVCACGRRACLGLYTDASALLARARELELLPCAPGIAVACTAPAAAAAVTGHAVGEERVADALADLVRLAMAGNAAAREIIAGHGRALGEALRTLIGVHDPHRIIIGGPYWGLLAELALPELRERALDGAGREHGVLIESSRLGDDVGAIGAASLFLERELSPARR